MTNPPLVITTVRWDSQVGHSGCVYMHTVVWLRSEFCVRNKTEDVYMSCVHKESIYNPIYMKATQAYLSDSTLPFLMLSH